MAAVDVSRWQFGITTVYHFLFVPLTIGLAPLVAGMQTAWVITGRERWYRLTKFFGKLFLINFALGVATGIVQEFQFGMNWSEYSRFVGDVFGAPLALEGLVAFFLESTFLGLWIFGWGRLPKLVHLATIWLVAIGVNASAYFIVAANSFMQHPVGARYNPVTGRAELSSIATLLANNTALAAFPHVVAGSLLTGAVFVAGVAGWWMVREKSREHSGSAGEESGSMWRPVLRIMLVIAAISGIAIVYTGDVQGKLMFKQQPMKMASAESLCHTETEPGFSILSAGRQNNCRSVHPILEVPFVLPWLAEGRFTGVTLQGVDDLENQAITKFGPGDYRPNLFVTYWSFRAMIGLAVGAVALVLVGWWFTRGGRVIGKRWFGWLCLVAIPTPFLANSAGWIFTEMGRQPWVVAPNPFGEPSLRLLVRQGVSPHASATVWISLVSFTVLYGFLAVVWCYLMRRYVVAGPTETLGAADSEEKVEGGLDTLSFAY